MFVDLKSILNAQLTDAGKIAFTIDIWTKIGMTSSFLDPKCDQVVQFFSKSALLVVELVQYHHRQLLLHP